MKKNEIEFRPECGEPIYDPKQPHCEYCGYPLKTKAKNKKTSCLTTFLPPITIITTMLINL